MDDEEENSYLLESQQHQGSSSSDEALRIAKVREMHTLALIHSRNQLASYTPALMLYVVVTYIFCIIVVSFTSCQPFQFTEMCKASYAGTAPFAFPKPVELDEASSGFHYFTTGAFGAAVALVFMQLLDAEKKGPSWNAQLYCALLINCIALFGQFGVAYHIVHPVENIFGRVVLIPRLLEWVSLVPMLMFMTFSLDVRTNEDVLRLWAYTIIQQFSVVCGCYANLTDNYTFAVVLLVLSSVAFLSIYVAVYFAFRRIESVTMEAMAEEERNTPINPKRRSSSSFELESDRVLRRMTPIKISEVLASVENVGVTMSFQLTLYCAIFWTVIAIVYFLGVFNIIDSNTEACIQAAVDFMTKCVYVQVLATSHGTVLSPEGVLMRLLILEERANAVFRQSIRFVFHELSTPLNTIAIGIETLAGQRLSEQGQEYLEGVQEGTNAIMDSLNDVRYLQSIENLDHDLRLSPFNFKAMVKELATQMASHAKDVGVMLLLAQDQRIPELFLGDKARLKPLVSCFILNGINLCKHPGGTCTVMSTTIESESPDKFGIRFAVKDDGDGLTTEEYKDLYNPARSSKNSAFISLYPFQKIISAHGGVIDVQTAPGKGSTFSFEIYFRVPQEAGITVELLNKAHLEGKVLKESIPLKHGVNPAAQHLTMERFNKSIAERLKVGGEAEERKSPKASSSSSVYSLPSHNPPSPSPPSPPRIPASSLSAQQTTPTERLTPVQSGAEIHTPIVHNLPSSAATSRSSIKTIEGPVREITSGDATQVLLVVDDVLSNRMMTGKVLQLMGFMVEFAEDGKQAVDMCTSRLRDVSKPYGVIMMDNMMPIMTGKEATMTLRSMNYNGTIVGLTGNVLDEDLEEFRESGCDEVITKPLDIAELKRTLSSLGIVIPKKQS